MVKMILVNFKTYKSASGEYADALARICEKVISNSGLAIIPVVQAIDLYRVRQATSCKIFVQHIDPIAYGACSGQINPHAVREAGASGTLLNHAERQINLDEITASIREAKDSGLASVVCVSDLDQIDTIVPYQPEYIAIELPELIGGNVSISIAKPDLIRNTVDRAGKIPVLCGAGIKSAIDVQKAFEYGARGILISSGVTKAESPENCLRSLISGFPHG